MDTSTRTADRAYADKLNDPRWQRRRLGILAREDFRCQACGNGSIRLEVHHLRYASADPWESADEDLECLCSDCHGWRRHWDALFPDLRDTPTDAVRKLLPLLTKMLAHMGGVAAAEAALMGAPVPTPEQLAQTEKARRKFLAELGQCT